MAEQQQVELDTDGFEEQEVQVAESKPEIEDEKIESVDLGYTCLLYTSPSPRDGLLSRMPSSA